MAKDHTQLYFHEEIMLLSLREDDGKLETGAQYIYANHIAASVLAELIMLERIEIKKDEDYTVERLSPNPIGDPLLDQALEKIYASKKERPASHWLMVFQSIKNLRNLIAEGLCDKGILRAEEGKVFFFFDKTFYPELNPKPEQALIARLEKAIFTDTKEIDERTLVLLSLLSKSELLKIPFDKKALKQRKNRIEEITDGHITSEAAQKAAEAAQTAIMVATMIPMLVTTTIIT